MNENQQRTPVSESRREEARRALRDFQAQQAQKRSAPQKPELQNRPSLKPTKHEQSPPPNKLLSQFKESHHKHQTDARARSRAQEALAGKAQTSTSPESQHKESPPKKQPQNTLSQPRPRVGDEVNTPQQKQAVPQEASWPKTKEKNSQPNEPRLPQDRRKQKAFQQEIRGLVSKSIAQQKEARRKEQQKPPAQPQTRDTKTHPQKSPLTQSQPSHKTQRPQPAESTAGQPPRPQHEKQLQPKRALRDEFDVSLSETNGGLSPIRTLKGDIASTVEEKKESVTSIREKEVTRARAQGEKPRYQKKREQQATKKNQQHTFRFLFITIGLLVAISGGGYAGYVFYTNQNTPVLKDPQPESFITYDIHHVITGDTRGQLGEMVKSVSEELTSQGAGRVLIIPVQNDGSSYTTSELLEVLEATPSAQFTRNLNQFSMYGLHLSQSGDPEPFWILESTNFSFAFAGMLDWEATLTRDLEPLFPHTATGTPTVFRDEVIDNQNIRRLTTTSLHDSIVYGVDDSGRIIITKNKKTFRAILTALREE